MMALLEVQGLRVFAENKEIIRGVALEVEPGSVHVIMGQNGSGKSTLLSALAGHPKYRVEGKALLGGKDLLSMKPHERAREGLFLAFQHPSEVPGVPLSSFLRRAHAARFGRETSPAEFEKLLREKMRGLGMPPDFAKRGLNEGFSGGEKKRSEMLSLAVLEPRVAMLDELDSGLDVDALGGIGNMIAQARKQNAALIIVTHYARILNGLEPDAVHVMRNGIIAACGKGGLARKIEENGYAWAERLSK